MACVNAELCCIQTRLEICSAYGFPNYEALPIAAQGDDKRPALQSYIHSLLRLLLFYRSRAYFSACSCTIAQTCSHKPLKKGK